MQQDHNNIESLSQNQEDRQPRPDLDQINQQQDNQVQKDKKMSQVSDEKVEKQNAKDKKNQPEPMVGFFELFRFASGYDKCLMWIGAIAAVINGASMPAFSIIFGEMIDSFGGGAEGSDEDARQKIVDDAFVQFYWFLIIGGISFLMSWIQMQTWITTGEKQAIIFRKKYFQAILEQDVSWFDQNNPNTLATKVATECFGIQGAIGEKVPTFLMTVSMVVTGFAVAFMFGWELALICTGAFPFLSAAAAAYTIAVQQSENKVNESYKLASGQSEQAISAIKTVKSLNGQDHEAQGYDKYLRVAYDLAMKYSIYLALAFGALFFTMIADYGVGFYFGSIFVENETNNAIRDRPYSAGDVVIVFFSSMMGGFSMGQATPCLKNFAIGRTSGYSVFQVLDSKPKISPSLNKGEKIENLQGNIELKNVQFTYPAKPDVQVLKGINIQIQANKKTALVGESGSGKSTIIQLLERFYDPTQGEVLIEGKNLQDLNLQWYRDNVGYVGQEPALFATSIRENLKYGKPDATEEQMIKALKDANAWDFVEHLEKKLDTFVGSSGSQLSGGQKQRLSIARAILKNPPILLLDEATSALDRKNEKEIQQTLDELAQNRTTIVIAHRLSTVQNSDHIIVIDRGVLAEQGSPDELMKQQGKYYSLAKNQQAKEQEEDQKKDEDEEEEDEEDIQNNNNKNMQASGAKGNKVIDAQQINVKDSMVQNNNSVLANQSKLNNKSMTKEEMAAQKKKEKAEKDYIMKRLYEFNKDEKIYMFLGGFFSAVVGCAFPFCALAMSGMMETLGKYGYIPDDEFKSDRDKYCLWFLIISLAALVGTIGQFQNWTKVAQRLTLKLREKAFEKLMNMPCGWFDHAENNAGALSARLGSDTQLVNGLTSTVVNLQIANLASFLSGLSLSFAYEWRTSLLALVTFPIIFIAGAVQAQFVQGFSEATDGGYKDSGNMVQESVLNIRTVLSFGNEKTILGSYNDKLALPLSLIGAKSRKTGIAFGFSQFAMFLVYAIMFYVGAIIHREHDDVEVMDMYTAIFALMYAGFGAGNNNQFMTDVGAAMNAARNIFKILDAEDEIMISNKQQKDQQQLIKEGSLKGDIELRNVVFRYPTRRKKILNGVSLKINSGEKVAFVGPSGCGKSTIMQLIMRFYEIESGEILIDGKNIKEYEINFLRSQFGVVSQEPVLFQGTIEENIKYNTPNVTLDQVKAAAQQANAASFIESDELDHIKADEKEKLVDEHGRPIEIGSGYQRQVGAKGGFLSGGQKQRVAIARAVLKQPKILLLDEATSALDSNNEKIVQESLDKIMQNKTTLAIAHRISTIKDSDTIFVFEDGKLVEEGNYEQLVAKKEYFYRQERGDAANK